MMPPPPPPPAPSSSSEAREQGDKVGVPVPVQSALDVEFEQTWESTSDLGEDDYERMKE